MLKKFKSLSTYIIYILGLFSGFGIYLLLKKHTVLKLDPTVSVEINPLELLVLLVNVLLAIYITSVVTKKQDLQKAQKELVIDNFIEYKTKFSDSVSSLLELDNFDDPITNSKFKILRKRFYSLILISKNSSLIVEENDLSAIKDKISEIWEIFTDTPKTPAKNASKTLKDGIGLLRAEKISKIEQALIEVEQKITELIIKISNQN